MRLYKDEKLLIKNLVVYKGLLRNIGLMFRRKSDKNTAYFFELKNDKYMHSFFVFFEFNAIFLDENFKVLKIKKIKPFRIVKTEGKYLIETTINLDLREGEKVSIR